MLFTSIVLVPTALATPAVQDLADLKTVINAAASRIGDGNNPNRGWGISIGNGGGTGTADLVNNITNTVLRMKFQVDTNKTAWLLPNVTGGGLPSSGLNSTMPAPPILTSPSPVPLVPSVPSLPLTSSIAMPSAIPTSLVNATTDLSTPYIDYVSAIPNLASSLTTLGRAYHREMNAPVNEAIEGLQQSLTTLQTTMLQSNLIGSQAVLRTIRASSSLENSKVAWGRFLNLPGQGSDSGDDSGDSSSGSQKRQLRKPVSAESKYYTHKELWGRNVRRRTLVKSKPRWSDPVAPYQEHRERVANGGAENARIVRPFVV
ncbi:hypothetical protein ACEQ8H_001138 [Pleosporales sp. CAS-2024a]